MRVATAADKDFIESIITHPEVQPYIGDDNSPSLNVAPYLGHPHVALIVEGGCFFGFWHGYGRLECHTCFLPSSRGKTALREGRAAIDYTFLKTNAFAIVTRVPQNNPAADWYARKMGFRLLFERPNAWIKNGAPHPVRYYELSLDDWIVQGHLVTDHSDDPILDCYASAVAALVNNGQADKATFFYNRWAAITGYPLIEVVTAKPVIEHRTPPHITRTGITVH